MLTLDTQSPEYIQMKQEIAKDIAEEVFKLLKDKITKANKWPPLLSRTDLMNFLGIKGNKASELLNRPDFPVIRDFGHPKVPTHLLMQWIDDHTQWIADNTNFDRWAL